MMGIDEREAGQNYFGSVQELPDHTGLSQNLREPSKDERVVEALRQVVGRLMHLDNEERLRVLTAARAFYGVREKK